MRLVFFLLLGVLAWWLIRRVLRSSSEDESEVPLKKKRVNKVIDREAMVACAHCQVYLPRGEAIWQGEHAFCGEAHRLAFLSKPPP